MQGHRRIGLLAASAALAISTAGAGAVFASGPAFDSWTNHRDGPALDCPTFVAYGEWELVHTLTIWFDANGAPQRDIERLVFTGRFYNPETGTSVADRGTKRFLDTLAPDGSYLSTVMTYQRIDRYVGEAGRVVLGAQDEVGDQPELRSVGHEGFTDANIAALCNALSQ